MFSKLTIKIPEQLQSRCSGVLFVNFELISHLFLVFLFFEQVNVIWAKDVTHIYFQ